MTKGQRQNTKFGCYEVWTFLLFCT